MQVIEYGFSSGRKYPASVIALGFFDGCHLGHKSLIENGKKRAEALKLPFSVFTFLSEGGAGKSGGRLTTTKEKLSLFASLGVDTVYVASFEDIKDVEAEDFIEKTLLCDLSCRCAVVGNDFRFGKGARGDLSLLSDTLAASRAEIIIVPDKTLEGKRISSSSIKDCLQRNDLRTANLMLGHAYFCDGTVVRGDGRGTGLGFPTANLSYPKEKARLGGGVYRTAIEIDGSLFSAVTNLGTCPTFQEREYHIESFIIDFDGDIYNKKVRIFFLDFIREETRYKDANSLVLQINVDKNLTIRENGELKWQEIGPKLQ